MYRTSPLSRVLSLAVLAGLAAPVLAAPAPPGEKAVIDVVICLDTSSSMSGLIDSAKTKLWDIVNDLGKVKPTPNLRVGLYTYGSPEYDPNAGWVRKEVDLTTDLDLIYQKLFALRINGGTEYVGRVSRDALEQQKWSDDPKALKLIFVCGNEPATQDPMVTLEAVAEKAKKKGIIVNTIFCGPTVSPQAGSWQQLAKLAGGRYASIDQNRNVLASITTPHDKELAELSAKLNETYLVYGGKEAREKQQNQALQDINARKLGAEAAATRAVAKSSALYRNEAWDLVDRLLREPGLDIKKLPVEQLSEKMQKMTPEEREKHVKEMLARRQQIQKQIAELSKKREAFVREQAKKNPSPADSAFDAAVRGTLRSQAAQKGIAIPK